MGDGQHSNHSGAVVACARSQEAVAVHHRIELCANGKDRIEVRGEDDHGAGALGGQLGGEQPAQDIAHGIGFHLAEAGRGEAGCKPRRPGLFSEGRSGNGYQLRLPVHDFAGISVQPGEGGVNRALGSERRDAGEGRSAGKERHTGDFRVAGKRRCAFPVLKK